MTWIPERADSEPEITAGEAGESEAKSRIFSAHTHGGSPCPGTR